MTGQVFLASYPKSGNTWLRAMLTVYLDPDRPLSLDALVGRNTDERLDALDDALGVDPVLLGPGELARARTDRYCSLHDPAGPVRFVKTHLANRDDEGRPVIHAGCGRAVYLVRHPFDVAISYARYVALDVAEICRLMVAEATVAGRPDTARPRSLPTPLGSWAGHVRSWTDDPAMPLLVVRYEDMLADTAATFAGMLRFVGIEPDFERVARAVRHSSLEELQRQERASGFRERAKKSTAEFFRKGEAGGWRHVLTAEQAQRIVDAHGDVMRRFGYLETT